MLTYERGDDHDTFCHLVVCFRKSVYRKSNDKLESREGDEDIGQPGQKILAFFNQPLKKTGIAGNENSGSPRCYKYKWIFSINGFLANLEVKVKSVTMSAKEGTNPKRKE